MTKLKDWSSDAAATHGDRLTWAREAAGMGQAELANRLGVRLATVKSWEEDRSEPRVNRLQMMAGMLSVSLRWLLTGQGDGLDAPLQAEAIRPIGRAVLADLARIRTQITTLSQEAGRLEARVRDLLEQEAA